MSKKIDKAECKARWQHKTVEQLENMIVQFSSVVCRTKREADQIMDAILILNELSEEKLQNEGTVYLQRRVLG